MNNLEFKDIGYDLERAEVPEGWLVREVMFNGCYREKTQIKTIALTFIPDPNHLWLKDDDSNGLPRPYKAF